MDAQFNGGSWLQVVVLFKVQANHINPVHRNFAGYNLSCLFVVTLHLVCFVVIIVRLEAVAQQVEEACVLVLLS